MGTKPTPTDASDVRWDLSRFYRDISDPQIDADVTRYAELGAAFSAAYRGKLADSLGGALADYIELQQLENKLGGYLHLLQGLDTGNAAVKAKSADVERALTRAIGEYVTFFGIELVELDGVTLDRWYASDQLVAKYRPWIEHRRMFKQYLLSEPVEAALTKRASFGSDAWDGFFEELAADLRFTVGGEEKTLSETLHVMYQSQQADERFEAMRTLNAGLGGPFAKYSAQTLYVVAGSRSVETRDRGYANPMTARNMHNLVPDDVVNALFSAVMEIGGPLARRYYRLKAAHLGLQTLRWSDRNAPMPFSDATHVTFPEGLKIVRAAYESFSPTLAKLVDDTARENRIDAPATRGKRSGAFNLSTILPGNHPTSYTFLNYLGSNRDVMVLAHELGHGVHGMLAGEAQGSLMFHAPITLCETASVFGEMTTFNFLKRRLADAGDTASLLTLIMEKVDGMMNTVVRQIGFGNFERQLHGMDTAYRTWDEPKKRSVEELDELWLRTLVELYGEPGEVFTYEDAEQLWAHIPHFHWPFYVYGYAFGELLTQSLYAQQARLGERFEPLYLNLLRAGGTKDAKELLAPFNLDPTRREFWADGIAVGLMALIDEAEELSRKMGVTVPPMK